jgi:lysophospholipid acyltransferase (LPLAT)-like uncharacterized protein
MTFFIMGARIVSSLAWGVVYLWSKSLKIRFVNRSLQDRFSAEKKNVIYAFWHSDMFMLPFTHRNSGHVIMVSESRDGEVVAGLLRHSGFEVVRGSSKRKGTRGLIGLVHALRKGKSVATAVDGPRGPRHEAKEGVMFLASKSGVPIIPVATGSRRYWTLRKTWDKFIVPVPFTEGVIQYGEPITVNGTSREEIASKRRELESVLLRLSREAAENAAGALEGRQTDERSDQSFTNDAR